MSGALVGCVYLLCVSVNGFRGEVVVRSVCRNAVGVGLAEILDKTLFDVGVHVVTRIGNLF